MQINPSFVSDLYAAGRAAVAPHPDGAAALGRAGDSFAATLAAGETAAIGAMTGAGDPHLLVQALAQTELAVETAVTIRNRMVEAYQEILRMPV